MESHLQEIDHLISKQDYNEGLIQALHVSIELCPWNIELRQKRALVFEQVGQYQSAISDIK